MPVLDHVRFVIQRLELLSDQSAFGWNIDTLTKVGVKIPFHTIGVWLSLEPLR